MNHSDLNEREIQYTVSRIKDLPSIPLALQRLLEIIQKEVTSLDELEGIVRYDPGLSSKILRIANSAYYGSRGLVKSLARALLVLGFQQARSICLCSLLMELLSGSSAFDVTLRERLWKHSFCTARLASMLVRSRPWVPADEAYVLGLLHDLGQFVLATEFADRFRIIVETADRTSVPIHVVEREFGLPHTKIGRWVAVRWGLPEVFQNVMEYHHAPWTSPGSVPEVKLVYLADTLAQSIQFPALLDTELIAQCRGELYISEDEWSEHCASVEEVNREVQQVWDLLR